MRPLLTTIYPIDIFSQDMGHYIYTIIFLSSRAKFQQIFIREVQEMILETNNKNKLFNLTKNRCNQDDGRLNE